MKSATAKVCMISMMASVVLVCTFLRIPVPIGSTRAMIHFGNAACILSGLILGPIGGGVASGLGSFLFDIITPGYIVSAPFTLIFKFIMGYICGYVSKLEESEKQNLVAAVMGVSSYIVLQQIKNFLKNMYFIGMPIQANLFILAKGLFVPITNAAIAVTLALPLAKLLKKNVLQL